MFRLMILKFQAIKTVSYDHGNMKRKLFVFLRTKKQRVMRQSLGRNLQGLAPRGLSPSARPHLLNIPQRPKVAPLSGDQMFKQELGGGHFNSRSLGYSKLGMLFFVLVHVGFLIPDLR